MKQSKKDLSDAAGREMKQRTMIVMQLSSPVDPRERAKKTRRWGILNLLCTLEETGLFSFLSKAGLFSISSPFQQIRPRIIVTSIPSFALYHVPLLPSPIHALVAPIPFSSITTQVTSTVTITCPLSAQIHKTYTPSQHYTNPKPYTVPSIKPPKPRCEPQSSSSQQWQPLPRL